MLADLEIRLLFPDCAEHAQRADVNETFDGHLQLENSVDQMFRPFRIDLMKIGLSNTFRYSRRMYDIIEKN